jgi:hypothetical protein
MQLSHEPILTKRCYSNNNQEAQMRFRTKLVAALIIVPAVLTQTSANALPYDPYPWCANYDGGKGFGGQNCGFSTWNQCMATVSGIGGFCVPNQFYNPGRPAKGSRSSRPRY